MTLWRKAPQKMSHPRTLSHGQISVSSLALRLEKYPGCDLQVRLARADRKHVPHPPCQLFSTTATVRIDGCISHQYPPSSPFHPQPSLLEAAVFDNCCYPQVGSYPPPPTPTKKTACAVGLAWLGPVWFDLAQLVGSARTPPPRSSASLS